MTDANAEQRSYWNQQAGPVWVDYQERLDRQIGPHGERALALLAALPGERVLDLGCGCGDSSLALAARVAPGGQVLGLDLSEPMLARARERAAAAGLSNASFRAADAQTAALEPASFDAAFSRFGVMFFADPVAAFRNVRGALRPGGRLAFVCWRPVAENDWVLVPMAAAAPHLSLPPPAAPDAPGPFSFGAAERVRGILEASGFEAIRIEAAELPMAPGGGDLDEAADTFLEVGPVASALREMKADGELRKKVRLAVRASFEPHQHAGRVELGSAIWLVQARRAL
jgi:SAM-dependent methyltransferase